MPATRASMVWTCPPPGRGCGPPWGRSFGACACSAVASTQSERADARGVVIRMAANSIAAAQGSGGRGQKGAGGGRGQGTGGSEGKGGHIRRRTPLEHGELAAKPEIGEAIHRGESLPCDPWTRCEASTVQYT